MQINSPFKLSDDVINNLCEKHSSHAIEIMQSNGRYPTKEQMRQLIEVSFWATLGKEEGQSISFSILFGKLNSYEFVDPFVFAEPIPFDIENLVKLSLALNTKKRFGVYPAEDGRLKIWGFGNQSLLLKSNVKSFGAGRIVVSLGHYSMLLTGDKARFLLSADSLSEMVFSQKLYELYPEFDDDCRFYRVGRFLQSCRYILGVIQAKKHGGTLLIIPESINRSSSFEPIKYLAKENWSNVTKTFEPLLQRFHQRHEIIDSGKMGKLRDLEETWQLEHQYQQALDDIATLAGIDGAVVANHNLNVLAFGAKIKKSTTQAKNIPLITYPFENDDSDENYIPTWGTRHQSAADFTLERKDSIAFVESEDGVATAFTFDYSLNKVVALRHLEYLQEGIFD